MTLDTALGPSFVVSLDTALVILGVMRRVGRFSYLKDL